MITDEQLAEFTERPSLRERARQAAQRAEEVKTLELDEEYNDLVIDSRAMLVTDFSLSPGELHDVTFERKQQKVEFMVDGIRFCAYNRVKSIMITNGQGDKEKVGEELICVFFAKLAGCFDWIELDAEDKLAQLGEKLPKT
jgi:hypothetical protein